MKQILVCCLLFALMLGALCKPVYAQPPEIAARSAVVLDAGSGRCLYAKDADTRGLIASTTKIMTALLICEQCDLSRVVTIPPEAAGTEGSSMGLAAGEKCAVRTLLYGLMLHSGNDAAVALALACDGNVARFVARMNRRAAALGLHDTHFDNPHGLDSAGNYATAHDLARLTRVAMQNTQFRQMVGTKQITLEGRAMQNHNKLLWRYPGATGVKTGYTKQAGRILVSSAQKDGWEAICVTLHDPDDWRDHARLLDYVFETYTPVPVLSAGERLGNTAVFSGVQAQVGLICAQTLILPLAGNERVQVRVFAPQYTFAPVMQVQAGAAEVLVDGASAGRAALYYEAPVARAMRSGWFRTRAG